MDWREGGRWGRLGRREGHSIHFICFAFCAVSILYGGGRKWNCAVFDSNKDSVSSTEIGLKCGFASVVHFAALPSRFSCSLAFIPFVLVFFPHISVAPFHCTLLFAVRPSIPKRLSPWAWKRNPLSKAALFTALLSYALSAPVIH